MTDTEAAVDRAWSDLADAEADHDAEHAARAIAELERLGEIPTQRRQPADA